ncbi:hypothetical protein [Erwinia psidii]|uniref:Uncharacterized protein n=1 Tax=Erwinia psidii TaxID=69224 RepID=A0A3N6RYR2_9GAMM|nr:hypothetical protein [Erwinia psidii]MCX8955744.1 hypothetical protein [Erwinia psidii]MCX8961698.1 hypothetical protein [Erwinia psidii]MCX8967339.1 hypothetical protein [Erwinia psidii]RQM37587.1 hypothetical protein EB241_13640 [Erwinia psidii]
MSAKLHFLQKLQAQQAPARNINVKSEADIAAFHRGMGALQESVVTWLAGTGIRVSEKSSALTEMLISNAAFMVPGFELHFERRAVKFTPLFLYGQGVTGCVEVTLVADGQTACLCRLFMRSAESPGWTYTPVCKPCGLRAMFNEDAFFRVIESLLP